MNNYKFLTQNINIILLFFIFLLFYYLFIIQIPQQNNEKIIHEKQKEEYKKISNTVNEFLPEKDRIELAKKIVNDEDNKEIIENIRKGINVEDNIDILLERTFFDSIISSKPYKELGLDE